MFRGQGDITRPKKLLHRIRDTSGLSKVAHCCLVHWHEIDLASDPATFPYSRCFLCDERATFHLSNERSRGRQCFASWMSCSVFSPIRSSDFPVVRAYEASQCGSGAHAAAGELMNDQDLHRHIFTFYLSDVSYSPSSGMAITWLVDRTRMCAEETQPQCSSEQKDTVT